MRPLFLLSNDDGVFAPGLAALAAVAEGFGDVVVVAPTDNRSGVGQAITLHDTLRAHDVKPGWYALSGTPVDCVYMGILHLCDRPPTLVLSGINDGYNLGTDVLYSGTVGAAREAQLRGISAIAASVDRGVEPSAAAPYLEQLIPEMIARANRGVVELLNLNVPANPRGLAPRRLGFREYHDTVVKRDDLSGRPYYWIGGPPAEGREAEDSDIAAVREGLATVCPLRVDQTDPSLDEWKRLLSKTP